MEALLASQHDEEDMADSDGLYPPHCTWTSAQEEPPPAADPYKNADCKVYENIHRWVIVSLIQNLRLSHSTDQPIEYGEILSVALVGY